MIGGVFPTVNNPESSRLHIEFIFTMQDGAKELQFRIIDMASLGQL
jgi:hypothetical protein